jgi:transposase
VILGDDYSMPRAYSDDLRCKILETYEPGEIGLEQLAEQFGVSYGYTKKIRRQQLQSGQMERPSQKRHGFVSRVTASVEQQLRAAVRRQPDLTLAELGDQLAQATQVRLSKTRLWEVLQRLDLRRKKNPSMRKNRTRL